MFKHGVESVAYLGFQLGGGGSKYFWKSGGICMAQRVAKPCVCQGGSGACPSENIFKNDANWCVLDNILLKFCKKKYVKIYIFIFK